MSIPPWLFGLITIPILYLIVFILYHVIVNIPVFISIFLGLGSVVAFVLFLIKWTGRDRVVSPINGDLDKNYDFILSIGQVVPHEVAGLANGSKNILIANSSILSTSSSAIFMYNSNNTKIAQNNILNSIEKAINLQISYNNLIENNTITNSMNFSGYKGLAFERKLPNFTNAL